MSTLALETTNLRTRSTALMGGQVGVHLRSDGGSPANGAAADAAAAAVLRRISAWADRLTRFTATSELTRLNVDQRDEVPVGRPLQRS